jgi:hypothetical protein
VGDAKQKWMITAGADFGVTSSGALYAKNAKIFGEINSSRGKIGGWELTDEKLRCESVSDLMIKTTTLNKYIIN